MLLTAQNDENGEVLGPADTGLGLRWKLHTPSYPEDRKNRKLESVGDEASTRKGEGIFVLSLVVPSCNPNY